MGSTIVHEVLEAISHPADMGRIVLALLIMGLVYVAASRHATRATKITVAVACGTNVTLTWVMMVYVSDYSSRLTVGRSVEDLPQNGVVMLIGAIVLSVVMAILVLKDTATSSLRGHIISVGLGCAALIAGSISLLGSYLVLYLTNPQSMAMVIAVRVQEWSPFAVALFGLACVIMILFAVVEHRRFLKLSAKLAAEMRAAEERKNHG